MLEAVTNTYATIYRGTHQNAFGDVVDSNTPEYVDVPIGLFETGKTIQDPSDPTPRTIRQILCHVPNYLGITTKDRIQDQATGAMYIIIGITQPPTLTGAPVSIVLDLKRVTATGA